MPQDSASFTKPTELPMVCLMDVSSEWILKANNPQPHSLCSWLSASFLTLSGYHVSSSTVEEGARWESRNLLQEVYDESLIYSEPEKNCTEPGKASYDAWLENMWQEQAELVSAGKVLQKTKTRVSYFKRPSLLFVTCLLYLIVDLQIPTMFYLGRISRGCILSLFLWTWGVVQLCFHIVVLNKWLWIVFVESLLTGYLPHRAASSKKAGTLC